MRSIPTVARNSALFPLLKLKFNYGNADFGDQEGEDRVHIFQTRFEIDL